MAKTPLLRTIQRIFTEHRAARALGLSTDALREKRAEAREKQRRERGSLVSRRSLLVGAGAGALTLGLPKPARASGGPSVAIIGGGIAGLSCALKLADKNIASTVFEASGRIGGRMFSNTSGYWSQGQISEWCGELIDTGHKRVRKLAQRFDLPLDDLLAAEPNGTEDTYRFFGAYYPKAQADADFAEIADLVAADADDAGYPTTYDSFNAAGSALDQMSIYDWIEARVPGGHDSPLGALLDAAYAIEYGADTTDQSALNLVYLLGYQPKPHGFAVFGESDERFHIRGGNQQLPEAIAASLGVGDVVKLGHSLERIKRTAAGRYKLSITHAGCTTDQTFDYVVLAIPFAVLRNLDYAQAGFDALKDEAIQDLGRGHNGKLQLQFQSRLWNTNGPWPHKSNGATYTDTGYQASWDVTRGQPGSNGILVLYSGGSVTDGMATHKAFAKANNNGVQADVATAMPQLAPVFPGLPQLWNGKATQSLPHKSDFFGASYSYWRVGQYTGFSGYEGVTQEGVLFCGEHTSTDFQGYMEGGATEGWRAGKELAQMIQTS
jgi:monoamine oxidase